MLDYGWNDSEATLAGCQSVALGWHQKSFVTQKQTTLDHQQGTQHTQHAGDMREQTFRQRRRASARSVARKRRHKKLNRTTAPFSQSTTFIQFPPGPEQRQVTLSSDLGTECLLCILSELRMREGCGPGWLDMWMAYLQPCCGVLGPAGARAPGRTGRTRAQDTQL